MHYIENSKNYFVTEEGEVFRGKRRLGSLNKNGYIYVRVYFLDGTNKLNPVHRWVAEQFIPKIEGKTYVNHIDGNKLNNHYTNLEWVTNQENLKHAHDNDLFLKGEDTWNGSEESLVRSICSLLEQGMRICDISKTLDCSYPLVKHIFRGNSWTHVSKEYNFKLEKRQYISTETVEWICERLEEGLKIKEILNLSENPKVTRDVISNVKFRKCHTEVSQKYNF